MRSQCSCFPRQLPIGGSAVAPSALLHSKEEARHGIEHGIEDQWDYCHSSGRLPAGCHVDAGADGAEVARWVASAVSVPTTNIHRSATMARWASAHDGVARVSALAAPSAATAT